MPSTITGTGSLSEWIVVGVFATIFTTSSLLSTGLLIGIHRRVFSASVGERAGGDSNENENASLYYLSSPAKRTTSGGERPDASSRSSRSSGAKSYRSLNEEKRAASRFRITRRIVLGNIKRPFAHVLRSLSGWGAVVSFPGQIIPLSDRVIQDLRDAMVWLFGLYGSIWCLALISSLFGVFRLLAIKNVAEYESGFFHSVSIKYSSELMSEVVLMVRTVVLVSLGIGLVYALCSQGMRNSFSVYFFETNFLTLAVALGLVMLFRSIICGLEMLFHSKFSKGDVIQINGIRGKVVYVGLRSVRILCDDSTVANIPTHQFMMNTTTNFSRTRSECVFSLAFSLRLDSCEASDLRGLLRRIQSEVVGIFSSDTPEQQQKLKDQASRDSKGDGATGAPMPPLRSHSVMYAGAAGNVHTYTVTCKLAEYESEDMVMRVKSNTALLLRKKLAHLDFASP